MAWARGPAVLHEKVAVDRGDEMLLTQAREAGNVARDVLDRSADLDARAALDLRAELQDVVADRGSGAEMSAAIDDGDGLERRIDDGR